MKFLYETERTATDGAKVAVSIPTTRPRILGRALAALANQTFQDFEVWVVYDNGMVVAEETAEIIRLLSVSHTVRELPGTGKGQVYGHNVVLWRTKSKLCLRLDDDIILNKKALELMVGHLDNNPEVGAVGGIWFAEGKRGRSINEQEINDNSRIDNPNAGAQMNYHPSDKVAEVEHLYSACLYRTAPMRKAGGWPVCYTENLHHREETDGTHRLLQAGYKLHVLPSVTGVHLWAPGGVREDPEVAEAYGTKRETDDKKFFVERLPQLPSLVRSKKVTVYSEHTAHAAGGERHFYATLAAACEADDFEVWGTDVGHGFLGAEDVEKFFGFDTSTAHGFKRRWDWVEGDGLDLGVLVSHAMVPWFPAKLLMGLVLFPMEQRHLNSLVRLYGNSKYSAHYIRERWGRDAGVIYPPPNRFDYVPRTKENRILLIGWYGSQKGQWEAIQAFRRSGIGVHGWKLTTVGWPGDGEQHYYNWIRDAVGNDRTIEIIGEVDKEELRRLVQSSRAVLGMRGINTRDPMWQEHFGLSVPEAMSAGTIPVLFPSGGYLEVYPRHLFKNLNELSMMMKQMSTWPESRWDAEARMAVDAAEKFGYERYRDEVLAAMYELLRAGSGAETPYVVGETSLPPDIAVVIPNYGHDEYLRQSVGSALASTYRDFEIIVVDDGSPDGSETAGMYKSDKVRILRQQNAGPSVARNAGISATDAEMILALDADDFLLPDALRILRKENDGETVTYGDCVLLKPDEEPQRTDIQQYSFAKLLQMDIIPQTTLFPRWAWKQVGGYKILDGYEDWELWISFGEMGCGGKKVDAVTHAYRMRDSNARHLEQAEKSEELTATIRDLHAGAYGSPQLGCCGKKEREYMPAWLSRVRDPGAATDKKPLVPEETPMVYDGPDKFPFHVRGHESRKAYKVRLGKPFLVLAEDVEFVDGIPGFRRA